jgi:hypothetical protein
MKKLISAIAILLFTGAAACGHGQSQNLLIGTWKLDRSGAAPSKYCAEPLTYTSKTATTPDYAGNPHSTTIPVTYVLGQTKGFPNVVWVMTDAGAAYHTTFYFSSKDKMVLQTAEMCAYVRI